MNNKYLLFVPLVTLFSILSIAISAQPCPCTVNAGADKNLCEPGGTTQLNGSYTGSPLVIEWTPAIGLNDPNIINPEATVDQTTTYTLKIKCLNNTNLVTNANFNNGNTGFSSDYVYSATNLVPEGVYTVTNNPKSVHPGFAPCGDHTGGGQMMVINGAGTPGLNVWCQTIPVKANTDYAFETWVASVVAGSPALLQFSINGQAIGPIFSANNSNCIWEQFTAVWNSGSSTSATICIVNQNTELGGNDFALDDISFKELCEITDEMTVFVHPTKQTDIEAKICQGQSYNIGGQSLQNEGQYNFSFKTWKGCDSLVTLDLSVIEVEAVIDNPEMLDCNSSEILLYGDKSSFGTFYTYAWTGPPGGISSDPSQSIVTVTKPGVYTLVVTYDDGTIKCTKSATVTVTTDYTKPIITAGPDGKLSCTDTTLTLSGKVTSPTSNYTILWTTPDGNIISDPDVLDPLIGSTGTYIMTVTNNLNGCTASDIVLVTKDPSVPKVKISGDTLLTCNNDTIWINGFQSDQGAGFDYEWSVANGGKINTTTDSLAIQLSTPGSYILTVQNLTTGCKSNFTLNIGEDKSSPTAEAGQKDTLSCLIPELQLTGSSNLDISLININWTTPDGNIKSGSDLFNPIISSPGIYYLNIENKKNGCIAQDSVNIAKDDNAPSVIKLQDQTLTCVVKNVPLDATGSSTGSDFVFSWTTPDGNITGGTDVLVSQCDKAGMYILNITNTKNGCVVADTLWVILDDKKPVADAGSDKTLNCNNTSLQLDGTLSSSGIQYSYQWTTPNGNIINGAATVKPLIDKPGTYTFVVTDAGNGCTSAADVNVSIDTVAPVITTPGDLILTCQQPQILISAINLSGSGNYSYLWSTQNGNIISGENTLTITIDKPGTYTFVTINDNNGCMSSGTVKVTSNSELPEVNAGQDLIINCINTQVSAAASVIYSGGTLDIIWTSSTQPVISDGNTLNPVLGYAGTYTITVLDPVTGCSASDKLVVTIDTIAPKSSIPTPELLTCTRLTSLVSLQTILPTWTYSWSTADGNITGSTTGNSVTVDVTGLYSITITDQSNGCISVLSSSVNEDKKNPVVSAGPDYELTCTIEEVTLTGNIQGGTTNKTILWLYNNQTLQNGTTLNPVVNLPGSYLLVVTDNINGCTADDSAEVTENTNYPTDFAIDIIPPGCTKLGTLSVSAVIGGNEPYTYSLNGGVFQNSDVFESIKSGTYFINIKDANGCEFGKQIMVPEPPELSVTLPQLVTIEYGKDEILNPQLNIPESNVESALWTPVSGLSCGDCLTPYANPVNETTYSLIVTDVTGCTAQAKVKVIVLKDFKLYIPNAFSPDADGINDIWMLFGDPKIVVNIKELRIFDRWGEQMYEAFNFPVNDPRYGWDGKLRGKNLKPAVFVYYFEAEFVDGSRRLYKGGINLIR